VLLRQKIDLLIRKVFGASSEKLDPSQLDLFYSRRRPRRENPKPPPLWRRMTLNRLGVMDHEIRNVYLKTCPWWNR